MNPSINPSLVYRLQSLLNPSKKVLICLPENPSYDAIAGGLSLYLSLTQKGKEVVIASPSKITVSIGDLFAVDKISDQLGQKGKNLVISFPYVEGSIEKVSYNIQNDKFNLVIEPRGEATTIDKNTIEFSRGGEGSDSFDIVFYIDVLSTELLGKLSETVTNLSAGKPTIGISTKSTQLNTAVKFGSERNTTVSEIIALVLSRLGLPFDQDISDNLLKAIRKGSQNFTANVSPDTFEAAAVCMRKQQGAQNTQKENVGQNTSSSYNGQTMNISHQTQKPNEKVYTKQNEQTPPDWLKPKIYRSSDQDDQDQGGTSFINPDKGSLI